MTKKEERQVRELDQTIDFLVDRMVNRNGGTSGDAMIAEVLGWNQVGESDYPRDLSDLERCFRTWLEAPPFLRAKMLWRLAQYTSHISEKHISLDGVRDRS
jgi:hypothetical protein